MAETNKNYTRLSGSNVSFDAMLRRFGVVTVMNAHVYDYDASLIEGKTAAQILSTFYTPAPVGSAGTGSWKVGGITLDTLKVANITVEGPDKTINGGQYNNALLKFGKSAKLEMQDALGNADAVECFGGGFIERYGEPVKGYGETTAVSNTSNDVLHIGEDFTGAKTIIGDSFFIDQVTGKPVKVKIIFYQFLPDGIFNLTQDAEGDASVFDLNGDLLTTNIMVGDSAGNGILHGVFYSIMAENGPTNTKPMYTVTGKKGKEPLTVKLADGYTGTLDGVAIQKESANTVAVGHAAIIEIKKEGTSVLKDVIANI